jgi:hypothetical protein
VLNLTFDTLSAQLSASDRAELDALVPDLRGVASVRLQAVGHSDSVPISQRNQARFADNYALSAARAASVSEYLSSALALEPEQSEFVGVGPDRPVASDATAEGRRQNRRVELLVTGVANAAERTVENTSATSTPEPIALRAGESALPPMSISHVPEGHEPIAAESVSVVSVSEEVDASQLSEGRAWQWPPAGYAPAIPNTKVVVQHRRGDRVELQLNGSLLSPLNFEGAEEQLDRDVAMSRWRGLDLDDGVNVLLATIVGSDGSETILERELHYAGPPIKGALLLDQTILVADGKTRPLIALRLTDRWGRPAREGASGRFKIESPYRSWWEVERLRENPLVMSADRAPTYIVGRDGIALIELEPTTTTGQVEFTLIFPNDQEQELRAFVEPGDRDWILVGLADGTIGYNTVSGNIQMGADSGFDTDYYDDGRLAFYAKGRVKGALLTAAFDSDGARRDRFSPLGGEIDPGRYYTVYGDNTEQRFDAASRERLYVKLERGTFLAMFGDFETGLTVTELSRYSRSMTGFHSEQHGGRFGYSAFAAHTDQAFVRDELRGDGTSGPYRLSRADVLAGSDRLVIESRDRFRPERVVATRSLRRHFDYDIDYTDGSINFREPIASRDFDFNPTYIMVDYETESVGSTDSLITGGRVAMQLAPQDSEVGVTLVNDDTAGAGGKLVGADVRYWITDDLEVSAELAHSETSTIVAGPASGSAYLVELAYRSGPRQTEAYVRETDAGFGLGQQRIGESGTRRSGVTLRNELGPEWLVEADIFRQENLVDSGTRTVVETESRYESQRRTASLGLRRVDETIGARRTQQSQTFVGGSWRFFDELLTTRLNLEKDFSRSGQSLDYPTRTLVGADVAMGERVNIFGEHEMASGGVGDLQMTRFGIRAAPLRGAEIDTSMQRESTEYGPRSFANLGMRQSFMVGEHWALDLGGERSTLLNTPTRNLLDAQVPPASGNAEGDFSTGYFGVAYRAPAWSFSSRFEHRSTDTNSRRGLISSFYREQLEGRGFTAEMRLLDRAGNDTGRAFSGNLRLGWAYRPAGSRWIILNRADWVAESRTSLGLRANNRRLVNNFNAHYAVGNRHSVAMNYSVKSVAASFDGTEVTGLLDFLSIEWRRQVAPRFDFGVHGSNYRALGGDVNASAFGIDVGVAVAQNFSLLIGYNFDGFDDVDFSRAHYTARGPFVQFKLKVDQASLRDLLNR